MSRRMHLFALQSSRAAGEKIAAAAGLSLSPHEEREFEDGEHKTRPLESVRGGDAYVLCSLNGDARLSVNDKLCRLLFFTGALRDAGAERITALVPYLCYARKDRKTKFRDPVTTRYIAALFEAVGVDRVVTLDVHNLAAFQNAFRCRTEHLEARMLFVEHFSSLLRPGDVIVISPDEGGVKRAHAFRQALSETWGCEIPLGFMEKIRSRGALTGETLVADVADKTVVLVDDLISSGGTLLRAAHSARDKGARSVHAAATHGLFAAGAEELFTDPALDTVVVTDSVGSEIIPEGSWPGQLIRLETASLLAEAVVRLHEDRSLAELLGPE